MNNGNPANVTTADSISFEYISRILGESTVIGFDRLFKNVKIAVSIRYLTNFFSSLEMPLVNCKIHLELNWTKNCLLSNTDDETTFKITSTRLYVPIVTLSAMGNVNLTEQLNEGFKRSAYWNEYKTKIELKEEDENL